MGISTGSATSPAPYEYTHRSWKSGAGLTHEPPALSTAEMTMATGVPGGCGGIFAA